MNRVREINNLNQTELELGISEKGSWHDQYKDSAYVHVGGLDYQMTEGDVITVFSQFGEIIDINMPRDKETGKPKGFAFLMYEDQRSTVLAVDNMTGANVLGRTIKCDHTLQYRQAGTRDEEGKYQEPEAPTYNAMPPELSGESDVDDEDPMAAFLKAEKRKSKPDNKKDKRKRIKGEDVDGESKEEKRRRKEEKRRRKEERDRIRAERSGGSRGKREDTSDDRFMKVKRESVSPVRQPQARTRLPERAEDNARNGIPGKERARYDDHDRYGSRKGYEDREATTPRDRDARGGGDREYGQRRDVDRYDRDVDRRGGSGDRDAYRDSRRGQETNGGYRGNDMPADRHQDRARYRDSYDEVRGSGERSSSRR